MPNDDLRTRIAAINALHNAVVDPRYREQIRCNCGESFRWGDDWELHRADVLIRELPELHWVVRYARGLTNDDR